MKKQSGFTLIELMVVMAIIAILATAGLAAYTGYIKKARDTTRIADLAAMNTIVLASLSATGDAPADAAALGTLVSNANNGTALTDPLGTANCMPASGTTPATCVYQYKVCDSGTGYAIAASLESSANAAMYATNTAGDAAQNTGLYEIGNCKAATNSAGSPTSYAPIVAATVAGSVALGKSCAITADCTSPNTCTGTPKVCTAP